MNTLSVGPKPEPGHYSGNVCTCGGVGDLCFACAERDVDDRALTTYQTRKAVIGILVEAGLVACDDLED